MPRLCLPGQASPARTRQQPWTLGSASSLPLGVPQFLGDLQ